MPASRAARPLAILPGVVWCQGHHLTPAVQGDHQQRCDDSATVAMVSQTGEEAHSCMHHAATGRTCKLPSQVWAA